MYSHSLTWRYLADINVHAIGSGCSIRTLQSLSSNSTRDIESIPAFSLRSSSSVRVEALRLGRSNIKQSYQHSYFRKLIPNWNIPRKNKNKNKSVNVEKRKCFVVTIQIIATLCDMIWLACVLTSEPKVTLLTQNITTYVRAVIRYWQLMSCSSTWTLPAFVLSKETRTTKQSR
jgi:hypothetical protein